jgi:ribonuclease R
MKKTKKDFTKFTKRNVHKRRSKEEMKNAIEQAIRSTGVGYSDYKLKSALDNGRRGRESSKAHRDEIVERGIFASSRSGFGFVARECGGDDIFIPEGKSMGAIDGDFVEVIYHRYENRFGEEKTEGRVRKIIEYGRKTVVGVAVEEWIRHGKRRYRAVFLQPDDHNMSIKLPILDTLVEFETGDKIFAEIIRNGTSTPECKVIDCFGEAESKEANYQAILAESEIPIDFTPEELAEAERLASTPISPDGRVVRDEIILTIDGEGAKDLDDAVSLRKLPGGKWRLGVHIADVSEYVREKTALDRAAMARGTSVYFTDKVVPMLPPALSNGSCSLNAGEEKYTLSAIIDLDKDGAITGLSLEPSIIKTRVRGVYSEVNKIFDGTAGKEILSKYKSVIPTLEKMKELYEVLLRKSRSRGYLDFDAPEAEILLGQDGSVVDIIKRERGVAEKMIEQFMLTANEAVATYLYERKIPCVYRIHERPMPDKLSEFLTYAHNLGLDTRVVNHDEPSAKEFAALLKMAEEKGIHSQLSYSMLRSMAKAKYSDVKSLHFGLGIENYCHFTSPIRRLSDLATHRIIKKTLAEGKRPESYSGYARRAAAAATEAELRALSAERKIENLYKCIFMSEHIGEIFPAKISSITSFGMFAMLDNTCEGLIPISEMEGVFTFDERTVTMRSLYKSYHLADDISVMVEECDVVRGKIRFSIVEEG